MSAEPMYEITNEGGGEGEGCFSAIAVPIVLTLMIVWMVIV